MPSSLPLPRLPSSLFPGSARRCPLQARPPPPLLHAEKMEEAQGARAPPSSLLSTHQAGPRPPPPTPSGGFRGGGGPPLGRTRRRSGSSRAPASTSTTGLGRAEELEAIASFPGRTPPRRRRSSRLLHASPFLGLDLAAEAAADLKAESPRCRRGGADKVEGGEPKARKRSSTAGAPRRGGRATSRGAQVVIHRRQGRSSTICTSSSSRRVASSPQPHVVLVTPPADPRTATASLLRLEPGRGSMGVFDFVALQGLAGQPVPGQP
jgi:hypothetical protein